MNAPTLTAADAYKQMATIRRFEEQILELGREGLIAGSIHLCLGHRQLAGQHAVASLSRG